MSVSISNLLLRGSDPVAQFLKQFPLTIVRLTEYSSPAFRAPCTLSSRDPWGAKYAWWAGGICGRDAELTMELSVHTIVIRWSIRTSPERKAAATWDMPACFVCFRHGMERVEGLMLSGVREVPHVSSSGGTSRFWKRLRRSISLYRAILCTTERVTRGESTSQRMW